VEGENGKIRDELTGVADELDTLKSNLNRAADELQKVATV
jgi:hypothetical protein